MTDQEIEKLKNLCEKEGFELDFISKSTQGEMDIFRVSKKDEWEGVEFAIADYNGIIYKIDRFETSPMKKIWFSHGKFLFPSQCKPSTEASYIEQLKAKARELYGDIKDGDRFDRIDMGFEDNHRIGEVRLSFNGWDYSKSDDKLYLGSICIYQQGRWAKKISEPVIINVSSIRYLREPIEYMGELIPSGPIDCTVHFTIEGSSPKIILKEDFRQLLSKCLEDYLNKS